MGRRGKERAEPQDVSPSRTGGGGGQQHRYGAAWLEFKQQQFNREYSRRDGRREGGSHARRRTGYEERFPLGACELQKLSHDGAERPARHDDRALRAERSARTDG